MNHQSLNSVKTITSIALAFTSTAAWAVPIGIIDSGTDLKHEMLINHAWINPKETTGDNQDNENNGYVDDIHGWNFAENNNQIIDYSYIGKFNDDVYKYFEIQLRMIEGNETEEEMIWMAEKRQDKNFIRQLMIFGNFVHGTHVAGVAAQSAPDAKIMAVKLLPTEVKASEPNQIGGILNTLDWPYLLKMATVNPMLDFSAASGNFMEEMLIKATLRKVADMQSKNLLPIGEYVSKTGMKVANCSFGTGFGQAEKIIGLIGEKLINRKFSPEEVEKYANYFLEQILQQGSRFVTSAPGTLFVMAAGNDGTDNDSKPSYPTNLKYDNTISVAATRGYHHLANFSNYGEKMVEIAAPGVGITSSIPGPQENETLPLSGTSQAAPFITNLAGKVMDANPRLTPAEVKKVLMKTVDKKSFLVRKVVSGGIANEARAVRAATLSASLSIDEAIVRATIEVKDVQSTELTNQMRFACMDGQKAQRFDGIPLALPSLFHIVQ